MERSLTTLNQHVKQKLKKSRTVTFADAKKPARGGLSGRVGLLRAVADHVAQLVI